MINIIEKKKNKQELTREEIYYIIDHYCKDEIPEYQMSALLMAIVLNDMTERETIDLTSAMLDNGKIMDLSKIEGTVVDKHSTGGIGDKVTLILAPLIASTGLKIAKMSGRGLGYTGGTIDKLESILGYQVNLKEDEFIDQVNKIGVSIISSNEELVPADKRIYALRDVTGTVESIPLIASSIMSKKIATGADIIVIDLKVGNDALIKKEEDARKLANLMIKIGKNYDKKVICVLSCMEQPLGRTIGNGLEVLESIEALKGNGSKDLMEVVYTLGAVILNAANQITIEDAKNRLQENIENGKAYEKFEQLVKAQGGDLNHIQISDKVISIKSKQDGIINEIDAMKLGHIAKSIGAGREKEGDSIQYGVGMFITKKIGEFVLENEEILKIYIDDKDTSISELLSCFDIQEDFVKKPKMIIDIIK